MRWTHHSICLNSSTLIKFQVQVIHSALEGRGETKPTEQQRGVNTNVLQILTLLEVIILYILLLLCKTAGNVCPITPPVRVCKGLLCLCAI